MIGCPIAPGMAGAFAEQVNRQIRDGREEAMVDRDKEPEATEGPSRRSFLGLSSVALAGAAFAGLTANAQEKASTRKAEHDHSSSDPGPENKALLGENSDSNNPPPTDHGDVVPLWYSFDLVKKRVSRRVAGPTR